MPNAADSGATVRSRRLRLGLSKEAMARAAGVSVITYKKVEDDRSVRDTSRALILAALDREEQKRDGAPAAPRSDVHADILRQVDDYYRYLMRRAGLDVRDAHWTPPTDAEEPPAAVG